MPGKFISKAEILSVSKEGLWILAQEKEFFLSYEQFPWFRNATVKEIYHFQFLHGTILHWPDLDVDLSIESLRHPERFPLTAKPAPKSNHRRAA